MTSRPQPGMREGGFSEKLPQRNFKDKIFPGKVQASTFEHSERGAGPTSQVGSTYLSEGGLTHLSEAASCKREDPSPTLTC